MKSPLRKGKEYRKDVYAVVERIIERQLTVSEHEEIRAVILMYVEDHLGALKQTAIGQGQKLKVLGKALYNLQHRQGVPADVWKWLKEELERMGALPYDAATHRAVSATDSQSADSDKVE